MSVPFGERGGWLRGCLDLASGRFPRFVFGGPVTGLLPVFHFHDERRPQLEPTLRYLAENGYRSVTAEEMAQVARRERRPDAREVALCFDDAWASVWTDAGPLLKDTGLRAIVYVIPGRVQDAATTRATTADPVGSGSPFMTWPEVAALSSAGTIDIQSHTYQHARIFTSGQVVGYVEPDYARTTLLNRPSRRLGTDPLFVTPSDLGAPLYEQRSRMSDGPRAHVPEAAHEACVQLVASEGGASFFQRPDWRARLNAVVARHAAATRFETSDEQQRAIDEELDRGRSELNARLGTSTAQHVCLPWGVSGKRTLSALKRLGFRSAIANRLPGAFAVHPGDDPFWLKRLPHRYIFSLPGRGRRGWFAVATGRESMHVAIEPVSGGNGAANR